MRILVTGASGMIGGELARRLSARHAVVAAVHRGAPPDGLPGHPYDLLAPASAAALLDDACPEAVVHCAAWADADACERDPEGARVANVEAVGALARACFRHGVRLVGLSTDLVLPGTRALQKETDGARPVLTYGWTKLEGERVLVGEHPQAAVARIALVTGRGFGRPTASESIAWALGEGRRLQLYRDQFRTPVDVGSVTDAVERMLTRDAHGLFHVGGPARVSRYELGMHVARTLGLREDLIQPVTQASQPGAPRPPDVSMDSSRARAELGWEPSTLEASIREGRTEREG
jgi:dTDP-4-dehydrorhamnose reductase